MRRREFIRLFSSTVVAWPLTARAQQAAMPVIGFLDSRAHGEAPQILAAFRQGLKETGFVEGQNVAIEYRFAGNHNERLPELAADLVRRQVNVIAAPPTPAALAAKAATTTIPIVFATGGDPVRLGLVASLNRPGGNITGVTMLTVAVAAKRLELLHELIPTARLLAVLVNPANPALAQDNLTGMRSAADAPRTRTSCPQCQYRARLRWRLRKPDSIAGGRACDRPRSVFHREARTTRQVGLPPRGASGLREPRIYRG